MHPKGLERKSACAHSCGCTGALTPRDAQLPAMAGIGAVTLEADQCRKGLDCKRQYCLQHVGGDADHARTCATACCLGAAAPAGASSQCRSGGCRPARKFALPCPPTHAAPAEAVAYELKNTELLAGRSGHFLGVRVQVLVQRGATRAANCRFPASITRESKRSALTIHSRSCHAPCRSAARPNRAVQCPRQRPPRLPARWPTRTSTQPAWPAAGR